MLHCVGEACVIWEITAVDAELVRTIAAFISIGLGVLIFGLLICKVYLRSPKLEAAVIHASIRAVEAGVFDFQVDLDIHAKGGDVYLMKLALSHSAGVFDPGRNVNKHFVGKLAAYPGYCILDSGKDAFAGAIKSLQFLDVTGFRLADDERRRISIIERIVTAQSAEGFWDWPTEGWTFTVRTSVGKMEIPLAFEIHDSGGVHVFCRDYSAAKSLIWSC